MIKEIIRFIIKWWLNPGSDFDVTYCPNSLHPVIVCPKCGSKRCVETDDYWSINHVCLDCGYSKKV